MRELKFIDTKVHSKTDNLFPKFNEISLFDHTQFISTSPNSVFY